MGVNHNGWVHHMKCGEQDGVTCQADNIKRDAYNWNQTVFNIVSPSMDNISPLANDLLDKRRLHSRDISGRALSVQFEEENTKMLLGFERNRGGAVNSSQTVHFKLYSKKDARRSEIVTEFEPRVRRAEASASRTLPADLAVFVNYADSNQRFVLTARRCRYQ
jgi:hypothetical protein